MTSIPFIGRTPEIEKLLTLHRKAIPSLAVVKGRRRIGKSRLIAEFASKVQHSKFWSFAGLAPQNGITAQIQRDHFARQLALHLKIPPLTFQDWNDAFEHLSLHIRAGDIILFDEISWMGAHDPSFIPKLKAWWDKQTVPMVVVLCGSISTWIEENILKNTAFLGRIALTLTLEPLSILDSATFIRAMGFQGSAYEAYRVLSILGGVPWYLEQVSSGVTSDTIIKQLCFEKDGMLVLEFDHIFHDLFNGKGVTYKKILNVLRDGMKTLAEIRDAIDFPQSGTLSMLMEHLITAGFVKKQSLWSFKTAKPSKQSLYRISDPYMRFYLKVIEPNRSKIDRGAYSDVPLSQLQGVDTHIGLQLEYLLLQDREVLLKLLGIPASEVVCDGAYRQSSTTAKEGCQIDYLVQTITKNLFVCEFKFNRREIGVDIIQHMQQKIKALKIPRGYATVSVLFHIGGVASTVETNGYFYRIIDIADFLSDAR